MTKDQILAELETLPPEDLAEIRAKLDAMPDYKVDEDEFTQEQLEEIDRRYQDHLANPHDVLTEDEFFALLQQRRDQ